ncbi:TonB-dependent receptor, partial [Phocaeicola sartorii]|uniref:TonB-dependent receptor n=1 Tax=Phocaeicola sartorii TaxID=671267 RepID=UPI00272B7177
ISLSPSISTYFISPGCVPRKWLETMNMQSVRIYLVGNNLFTLDHIKFQDPESSATSAGQYYPQSRTYTVGVNVTF